MTETPMPTSHSIAALLADVDGTLVTKAKVLTKRAIEAVRRLAKVPAIEKRYTHKATH